MPQKRPRGAPATPSSARSGRRPPQRRPHGLIRPRPGSPARRTRSRLFIAGMTGRAGANGVIPAGVPAPVGGRTRGDRWPGRDRCRRPRARSRATRPGTRGSGPMTGRWSGEYGRKPRYARMTRRRGRNGNSRIAVGERASTRGERGVEADALPARADRTGPERVPSTTGEVCSAASSVATLACTRRRRPCAGPARGSGSVTRMKPRRGRTDAGPAGRAPTSAPGAGRVDHRPGVGARGRCARRRPGRRGRGRRGEWTAVRTGAPERGPQPGARRREHRLDLHVLRIVHAAGEAPGEVRLVAGRGVGRDRSALTPAARCPAAKARAAQAGVGAATTRPPLGSSSKRSRPCSAREGEPERPGTGRSSSGPGALSEMSRLPSPARGAPRRDPGPPRRPAGRPVPRSRRRRPRPPPPTTTTSAMAQSNRHTSPIVRRTSPGRSERRSGRRAHPHPPNGIS